MHITQNPRVLRLGGFVGPVPCSGRPERVLDGSETWIRTMIRGFRVLCPAVRRSRINPIRPEEYGVLEELSKLQNLPPKGFD